MELRLRRKNLGYERPNIKLARYKMLKHKSGSLNPQRYQLLDSATDRHSNDGINSVKYRLIKVVQYKLYTHLFVDVGKKSVPSKTTKNSNAELSTFVYNFQTSLEMDTVKIERSKAYLTKTGDSKI
jgi:hypothetical protein